MSGRLQGIIFDFDGTVVDSRLDFNSMRSEMQLPPGAPIIETLAQLPADRAEACHAILDRYERQGAQRAVLMPGVEQFLAHLQELGLPAAVVTRNARDLTLTVIKRLELQFEPVFAREDAPAKPEPDAVLHVCRQWGVLPQNVLVIGDYLWDMLAGRRAGAITALYTAGRSDEDLPGMEHADYVLHDFVQARQLLASLL